MRGRLLQCGSAAVQRYGSRCAAALLCSVAMWRRCAALLCGVALWRRCAAALLRGVAMLRRCAALFYGVVVLRCCCAALLCVVAVRLAAARCCLLLSVALCAGRCAACCGSLLLAVALGGVVRCGAVRLAAPDVCRGEDPALGSSSGVRRVFRRGSDVPGPFSGVLRVSKRESAAPGPFSVVLRVSRGKGADRFAQGVGGTVVFTPSWRNSDVGDGTSSVYESNLQVQSVNGYVSEGIQLSNQLPGGRG